MGGTDIRETIRMHVYIMRMSKNERDLIREENKFSTSPQINSTVLVFVEIGSCVARALLKNVY